MCGIFGGIKEVNIDKIKILGILNESRGTDSSGVFDNKKLTKAVLKFSHFSVDHYEALKDYKGYIVGHTRFATTGKKTERNAHPFTFGNITGVHNGVISNFEALKLTYNCPKLECDSEIIFYLLNLKGVDGLKELQGYFAIVYRDSRNPNKLYMLNHHSDLAYTKQNNAIYFASDSTDLETAFTLSNKFIELDKDTLYEIDINTLDIIKTKIEGLQDYSLLWANYGAYDSIACKNDFELDFKCTSCKVNVSLDDISEGFCPYCKIEFTGDLYECFDCGKILYTEKKNHGNFCKGCYKEHKQKKNKLKSNQKERLRQWL